MYLVLQFGQERFTTTCPSSVDGVVVTVVTSVDDAVLLSLSPVVDEMVSVFTILCVVVGEDSVILSVVDVAESTVFYTVGDVLVSVSIVDEVMISVVVVD
jgi:hypothetical protein